MYLTSRTHAVSFSSIITKRTGFQCNNLHLMYIKCHYTTILNTKSTDSIKKTCYMNIKSYPFHKPLRPWSDPDAKRVRQITAFIGACLDKGNYILRMRHPKWPLLFSYWYQNVFLFQWFKCNVSLKNHNSFREL